MNLKASTSKHKLRSEKTTTTSLNSLSYAVFFTLCFASLASDNPTFLVLSLLALGLTTAKIIIFLVHQKNKLHALRSLTPKGILYLFDQLGWQQKQIHLSVQSPVLKIIYNPKDSTEEKSFSSIHKSLFQDSLQSLANLFFSDFKINSHDIKASLNIENHTRPILTSLRLFLWMDQFLKTELEKRTQMHFEISQFMANLRQDDNHTTSIPFDKSLHASTSWIYCLDFAWVDQSMYLEEENPYYSLQYHDTTTEGFRIFSKQKNLQPEDSILILHQRALEALKKEAPKVHDALKLKAKKTSSDFLWIEIQELKNMLNFAKYFHKFQKNLLSTSIRESTRIFFDSFSKDLQQIKSPNDCHALFLKLDQKSFVGRLEKDEAILFALNCLKKTLELISSDDPSCFEQAWKVKQRCIHSVNKIGYPGQRYQKLMEEKYSQRKSSKLLQALSHAEKNVYVPAWSYLINLQDLDRSELSCGDLFRYFSKIQHTESFQENPSYVLGQSILLCWEQCKHSQPSEFHLAEEAFANLLQLCRNSLDEDLIVTCLDLFQDQDPKSYKIDGIKTLRKEFESDYRSLKNKISFLEPSKESSLEKKAS